MKLFKNINFGKLKEGLTKTRDKLVNKLSEVITGKAKLDAATLDEIEEILISADLGYDTTMKVIEAVRVEMKSNSDRSNERVLQAVKEVLTKEIDISNGKYDFLPDIEKAKPFVILIVGVNGAGKTTTIGKLASNFKNSGLDVIIGAADTFRAAANEQLEIWADRAGVKIVQKHQGADTSSVAYETVQQAIRDNDDVVMIDTAGRLHNKSNLMEELKKIRKVVNNLLPNAPNEVFLVIDGTTGQNGIQQAQEFSKYTDLSGLIITKLDGTAKGGVVFQICNKLNIPVRYIGVGEGLTDLQNFDPALFVEALFEIEN